MLGPRIVRDLLELRSPRKSRERTLIISRDARTYIDSNQRSIRPLVEAVLLLGELPGCTIYDRTVGLAAAKLHATLEPKAVFAQRMSREAQEFYRANGIEFHCEQVVETIISRDRARTDALEVLARRHESAELLDILTEFC